MVILALDAAGSVCDVCVWRDGAALARGRERMTRGQDARLVPMIVAAMGQAGLSFDDLDRVAATRGPGSFTGIRVGLAAARGIALATNKPVVGIDRLAVYRALAQKPGRALLVVIDSRRAELFTQYVDHDGKAQEPRLMTQPEIDAVLAEPETDLAGDMAWPDADTGAACARLAAAADLADPDFLPRPLYLRAPDVSFPKAT